MKRWIPFLIAGFFPWPTQAVEFSGNIAAEMLLFPRDAQFDQQMDDNLTLSFKPKMVHAWNNGDDELTVELFLRADDKDD